MRHTCRARFPHGLLWPQRQLLWREARPLPKSRRRGAGKGLAPDIPRALLSLFFFWCVCCILIAHSVSSQKCFLQVQQGPGIRTQFPWSQFLCYFVNMLECKVFLLVSIFLKQTRLYVRDDRDILYNDEGLRMVYPVQSREQLQSSIWKECMPKTWFRKA